jgi:hypothetical protein
MIRDRGSNYTAAVDAVLADARIRTVLLGESHSQMEGFQSEDRHNPLPHIGPSATALN